MAQLTYRSPGRTRPAIVLIVAMGLAGTGVAVLVRASHAPQQPPSPTGPSATASIQPTLADVTWRPVAGVALPFSRLHGPRITSGGQAAGYSRSEQGAALTAVQVLMRTSASVGPAVYEPVLATQVTAPICRR